MLQECVFCFMNVLCVCVCRGVCVLDFFPRVFPYNVISCITPRLSCTKASLHSGWRSRLRAAAASHRAQFATRLSDRGIECILQGVCPGGVAG